MLKASSWQCLPTEWKQRSTKWKRQGEVGWTGVGLLTQAAAADLRGQASELSPSTDFDMSIEDASNSLQEPALAKSMEAAFSRPQELLAEIDALRSNLENMWGSTGDTENISRKQCGMWIQFHFKFSNLEKARCSIVLLCFYWTIIFWVSLHKHRKCFQFMLRESSGIVQDPGDH